MFKIGTVVLEKIFKWSRPHFPHLCAYLHFNEDMAIYLNKLEFPSHKDNLY
jgi:hypothetical protein